MLPKFLGIGAQKSGTTWLHKMLSAHDEIWLPHVKELHYFDRKFPLVEHRRGNVRTPGYDRVAKHLTVRLRKLSFARIKDRFSFRRWPDLNWEMRYLFGDLTDEWYASLFDGAGTRVPGEITPAYSCLSEQAIKDVHRLIPEARLVLLLRDPIERAWSHAKMDLASASKKLGQPDLDRCFVAHFSGAASRVRGDYVGMIDRWLSVFPADQLLIGFYDEIVDAPQVLLRRICQHIGVSIAESCLPPIPTSRVNASVEASLPTHLRVHLASLYIDSMEVLARRYGSYPSQWLDRTQRLLGKSPGRP